MNTHSFGRTLLIIAAVAVIGVICYVILYAPDRRTDGQKVSDAINALPGGVDKAARQLENRTPADKMEDAAEDMGNDLKKATNQQ
jgi:hypothetical protein